MNARITKQLNNVKIGNVFIDKVVFQEDIEGIELSKEHPLLPWRLSCVNCNECNEFTILCMEGTSWSKRNIKLINIK